MVVVAWVFTPKLWTVTEDERWDPLVRLDDGLLLGGVILKHLPKAEDEA